MNYKYITIDNVIERVFADFPLAENEFQWSDAIRWIGELLKLINQPKYQLQKVCTITIEDYKGELPIDLFQVQTFKDTKTGVMMKYTGDPHFNALHCTDSPSLKCSCNESKYQYKLNDNYIFTGFEEGEIEIAYFAIALDDRGYPLIPDEEKIVRALYWEVALKLAFRLLMSDKLSSDKYTLVDRERNWYVGKAMSDTIDINTLEAIKNFSIRLIPKFNTMDDQFKYFPEKRYNHNTNNFNQGAQT